MSSRPAQHRPPLQASSQQQQQKQQQQQQNLTQPQRHPSPNKPRSKRPNDPRSIDSFHASQPSTRSRPRPQNRVDAAASSRGAASSSKSRSPVKHVANSTTDSADTTSARSRLPAKILVDSSTTRSRIAASNRSHSPVKPLVKSTRPHPPPLHPPKPPESSGNASQRTERTERTGRSENPYLDPPSVRIISPNDRQRQSGSRRPVKSQPPSSTITGGASSLKSCLRPPSSRPLSRRASMASFVASISSIASKDYRFIPQPKIQKSNRKILTVRHWKTRARMRRPRIQPGTIAKRHIIVAPGKRAHTHKISWRILPKMVRNRNRNRNNKIQREGNKAANSPRSKFQITSRSPATGAAIGKTTAGVTARSAAIGKTTAGVTARIPATYDPKSAVRMVKRGAAAAAGANRNRNALNRNRNNDWDAIMQENVGIFYEKYEIQDKNTAALEDFTRFCTLGEGAFGRVMMLQHHGDRQFYAMKILKKDRVMEGGQEANCLNEKRVMQALENPFIVNLAYHMKNNSYCFMVMEFITGGEMFDLLQDNGGPLELEDVQFYMSNVVLGFEYLQECNIVYRDLKPENVLLAGDGYAKIADFGLSKRVDGKTYTLCGTLEYLAPEVVAGAGYYKNFDWWTVGVLTYELAAGFPPFAGADEIEMFSLIQAIDYEIPEWFSDELSDLVDGFLQPDSNRLGSRSGVDEIKNHPFYEGVDWFATYMKAVPPPFVPEHKDPTNPRNFKKRVVEEPIRVSAHDLAAEVFFDF